MEQAPLAECCEYTSEKLVARSVKKLPKIMESKFGLLIQQISSVDKTRIFNESTPRRYANMLELKPPPKEHYYWLYDDRIWVSNGDTKAISGAFYFEEEPPSSVICPKDCDCMPKSDCDPCLNPLDREFRCPGALVATVRSMVEKELLATYFNVPQDNTTNNLDEQGK